MTACRSGFLKRRIACKLTRSSQKTCVIVWRVGDLRNDYWITYGPFGHPSASLATSSWDSIFRKIIYRNDSYSLYRAPRPQLYITKTQYSDRDLVQEVPVDASADNPSGASTISLVRQRQSAGKRRPCEIPTCLKRFQP
jgi:hypothetical protein